MCGRGERRVSVAVEVTRWNCGGGRDGVSMREFGGGARGGEGGGEGGARLMV